jgi:tetratricopeptide (TPR) repeat protein
MNFRRLLVLNRIPVAIILVLLGLLITFKVHHGIWISWLFFVIAILTVVAHFMLGPITLIQKHVENGDIEGAQFLLSKVKKPEWLYKPVRSAYYMLQSNFSTMSEDYDVAETQIRKSLSSGMPQKELEGSAYLQLGTINYKKGNVKEAYENLKKAIQLGVPDKDSEAGAYLQLASISMNKRDFRSTKHYYAKAVACKPTNEMIKGQLAELKKYVSRIPG